MEILDCYMVVIITGFTVIQKFWQRYMKVIRRNSCYLIVTQVLYDCYMDSFSLRNRLEGAVIFAFLSASTSS